jgi:hypothetical protein
MKTDIETMNALQRLFTGKPIDEVAPMLVVTVARALVIEAAGDRQKLVNLVDKFVFHLSDMVGEMATEGDGEVKH